MARPAATSSRTNSGDVIRQIGTEMLSRMLLQQNFAPDAFTPHIFADGDKLHLQGDNPFRA